MGGGEGSILSVLGIEDNVGCSCLSEQTSRGLTPTEKNCPPEHCLPGVKDIPSVIGEDDLLHKHLHHKEGSISLKTLIMLHIFSRLVSERLLLIDG